MSGPTATSEELDEVVEEYARRTNSHDFDAVAELIAPDASYWFTEGRYQGHDEIRAAFERTWRAIEEERYSIHDLKWVVLADQVAVCTYRFSWEGLVEGRRANGQGIGTNVFVRHDGAWRIVHEHLSSAAG
jgi:uncharacterized protein (TIGR02246 family)